MITRSGRSPGEGNGNPLRYSCLENPKDRGTWQATVDGVTKSQTELSMHSHTHTLTVFKKQHLIHRISKLHHGALGPKKWLDPY